jgi:hypothetical protein
MPEQGGFPCRSSLFLISILMSLPPRYAPCHAVLRGSFANLFASGGRVCRKVKANWRRQAMKGILFVSLLILLMPTAYAASWPGDSANGKHLYDANCMGCHDTSVLTRKERIVQSLDALKEQLASCTHMAKKELSETETQHLLKYLNEQFYHFR